MLSERMKARQRELKDLALTREGLDEVYRLYAEKCIPSQESGRKPILRIGYLIQKIVEAEYPDG